MAKIFQQALRDLSQLALDLGLSGRFVGQLIRTSRHLTNPKIRVPLRSDLPDIILYKNEAALFETLERELAKYGETIHTVGTITIAYPHKNPLKFPGHQNNAEIAAAELHGKLRDAYNAKMRKVHGTKKSAAQYELPFDVQFTDAICENVRLGRSEDQSTMHALTGRQIFDVVHDANKPLIDFLDPEKKKNRHLVILVDGSVEQGTTLANLASYLVHNGAEILMATSGWSYRPSLHPQIPTRGHHNVALKGKFASASHKTALIDVGMALLASAQRDKKMGQQVSVTDMHQALEAVEKSLNKHGGSLLAMTAVETERLLDRLEKHELTYTEIVKYKPPKDVLR